jgi:hypothetical protein
MVEDIVMLTFLVLAGAVYVFYLKKVKQPGPTNAKGKLATWMAAWVNRVQPASSVPGRQPVAWSMVEDEIVAALDDIYQEFIAETSALRHQTEAQIKELRQELRTELRQEVIQELRTEVLHLALKGTPESVAAESPVSEGSLASGESDTMSQQVKRPIADIASLQVSGSRHFAILDGLYQGKSPEQIATELKVGVQEVHLIQTLLENPSRGQTGD